jgi:hypothetical protein
MSDWQDTLAAVAPGLATAILGPMGGVAVRAIEGVFGLDNSTPEQLAQAVSGATPDQLLALKKADQDFTLNMKKLDIDLERISADDRNSARNREASVKDRTPALLALLMTFGFFGTLLFMLLHPLPKDVTGAEAFLLMLGALTTGFTMAAHPNKPRGLDPLGLARGTDQPRGDELQPFEFAES